MKCEIIESEEKWKTPGVGEYFSYSGAPNAAVYRRIIDDVGDAVFQLRGEEKSSAHIYYAEMVNTCTIVSISNPNITLLEQVEPAKFRVKE